MWFIIKIEYIDDFSSYCHQDYWLIIDFPKTTYFTTASKAQLPLMANLSFNYRETHSFKKKYFFLKNERKRFLVSMIHITFEQFLSSIASGLYNRRWPTSQRKDERIPNWSIKITVDAIRQTIKSITQWTNPKYFSYYLDHCKLYLYLLPSTSSRWSVLEGEGVIHVEIDQTHIISIYQDMATPRDVRCHKKKRGHFRPDFQRGVVTFGIWDVWHQLLMRCFMIKTTRGGGIFMIEGPWLKILERSASAESEKEGNRFWGEHYPGEPVTHEDRLDWQPR